MLLHWLTTILMPTRKFLTLIAKWAENIGSSNLYNIISEAITKHKMIQKSLHRRRAIIYSQFWYITIEDTGIM